MRRSVGDAKAPDALGLKPVGELPSSPIEIHEGRSVVEVARQAGHSPTMTLDVYAHVLDEFDIAEPVSAEDQIAQARRDVSGLCPLTGPRSSVHPE
jgi:hypothetical protein